MGRGKTVVAKWFALSAVLIACFACKPPIERAREGVGGAPTSNDLRVIGDGILMYENDHGKFPDTLDDLLPGYLSSERVLVCPRDEAPMTIGKGLKCSFHYVGPLRTRDERVVIAYDKRGNTKGGRNVLFMDHHVEWIAEADFGRALQESLEIVKQKEWDKYSPERRAAIEAFHSDKPPMIAPLGR